MAVHQNQDGTTLATRVDALASALDPLIAAITAAIHEPASAGEMPTLVPGESDRAQLMDVCLRMRDMLAVDDARVANLWAETSDLLVSAFGNSAATLGTQIRHFEFDKALATLDGLVHNHLGHAR
jgi:hypothetical protein